MPSDLSGNEASDHVILLFFFSCYNNTCGGGANGLYGFANLRMVEFFKNLSLFNVWATVTPSRRDPGHEERVGLDCAPDGFRPTVSRRVRPIEMPGTFRRGNRLPGGRGSGGERARRWQLRPTPSKGNPGSGAPGVRGWRRKAGRPWTRSPVLPDLPQDTPRPHPGSQVREDLQPSGGPALSICEAAGAAPSRAGQAQAPPAPWKEEPAAPNAAGTPRRLPRAHSPGRRRGDRGRRAAGGRGAQGCRGRSFRRGPQGAAQQPAAPSQAPGVPEGPPGPHVGVRCRTGPQPTARRLPPGPRPAPRLGPTSPLRASPPPGTRPAPTRARAAQPAGVPPARVPLPAHLWERAGLGAPSAHLCEPARPRLLPRAWSPRPGPALTASWRPRRREERAPERGTWSRSARPGPRGSQAPAARGGVPGAAPQSPACSAPDPRRWGRRRGAGTHGGRGRGAPEPAPGRERAPGRAPPLRGRAPRGTQSVAHSLWPGSRWAGTRPVQSANWPEP